MSDNVIYLAYMYAFLFLNPENCMIIEWNPDSDRIIDVESTNDDYEALNGQPADATIRTLMANGWQILDMGEITHDYDKKLLLALQQLREKVLQRIARLPDQKTAKKMPEKICATCTDEDEDV